MHVLITGGAGFIGSHVTDHLLEQGKRVTVYDNLSTGHPEFLAEARKCASFSFVQGDCLDRSALARAMDGVDLVIHLAANADVRFGIEHPGRDLEQNTIATFNVLEAMRESGSKKIAFSSTGSVYGENPVIPTPENAPFPIQTSLYGASKLAGEWLIAAYCEGFGFRSWIFRFVSVFGERYTHGHLFDFYKSLRKDPTRLKILGDGRQKKSYLYVRDCVAAMDTALRASEEKVNVFNLGTDEYTEVNDSIRWMCEYLGVSPLLEYTGGAHGWAGDNPFIFLDCSKIHGLGWKPTLSIKEAAVRTLRFLESSPAMKRPVEEKELSHDYHA